MKKLLIILLISASGSWGNRALGQLVYQDSILCSSEFNSYEGQPIYHEDVDFLAEFAGGEDKLLEFISNHIHLSKASEGVTKISVVFIIDSSGIVRNPCILQRKSEPPLSEFDYNAIISIFNSMPRWRPALSNNRNVNSILSLPIVISIEN